MLTMASNLCYNSSSSLSINTKPPFLSQQHHTFLSRIYPTLIFLKHKNQISISISDFRIRKHYSNPPFPLITSFKRREEEVEEMTIKSTVRVSDGKLMVKDKTILTGVAENVTETSAATCGPVDGVFLGAEMDNEDSRHVVSLGRLNSVRFMACFRFKLWWMAQKMGDKGSEIPLETQFLLVETKDGSHLESNSIIYTVFLPLIEGSFRACLQGNASNDKLELCLESGDVDTKTTTFSHALFISAGTDPFATIHNAFTAVRNHLNTFRLRHEKKLPGIIDYFGWCTWDAFYQEVTQEGVEDGLQSLSAGGAPPKFVIIDDGWQSVAGDTKENGSDNPPLQRLTGIKENPKFQNKEDPELGIKSIVNIAKEKHGVKYVYVWHAITGYWGGVRPGMKETEEYGSVMSYPNISKGVKENEPTWKTDPLAVQGLGLVNPSKVFNFYDNLHKYLSWAGIDGVKVDVQCILETLGSGLGGRVELTKQYHQALDASISRNFPDNGCIACMSHNTDALYYSKQTAVVRASDDFYPRDPVSHTIHIASVAYNSIFLGEFMQPDWDMFHSLHPAAEYHASARAISGGPVYVSDKPGSHDFDLLKKMLLPDGSVLRARLPGRPTADCLFNDPARDGVSLLKIWNMNAYGGVLGVYNCQGAAWSVTERKNAFHPTDSAAITGYVRGRDVHLISEAVAGDGSDWNGDCVFYAHHSRELVVLPHNVAMPLTLKVLEHEVFVVSPVKVLSNGHRFAPIGLVNMFNAGGSVQGLVYEDGLVGVHLEIKGCGKFGAYCSVRPTRCLLEDSVVDFEYDNDSGLLSFAIDHLPKEGHVHHVKIEL
uniref:galactinol--sucrose galactosyltransferase n=1 Tax=Cicer arietinum TaxID=3827 RepID=A0A1S2YQT2_CICAR|nr:probable galactinol--sucrose galactosyltransferase 6 isoform X2 [Cicer arietinum]